LILQWTIMKVFSQQQDFFSHNRDWQTFNVSILEHQADQRDKQQCDAKKDELLS